MKAFAAKLGEILAAYGGWGILATSFLDSTFVPMPGVNDLLLLHLSSRRPALALLYALECTLGSLLGCYVMYALGRGGGALFRRGRITGMDPVKAPAAASAPRSIGKAALARLWLRRNDFVSVLVMSLLPPPAPFKVFVVTAGALRVSPVRFGVALLAGRGSRFVAEGLLGARYGPRAEAYIQHHIGWVSLALAVVVVVGTVVYQRLLKPRTSGQR